MQFETFDFILPESLMPYIYYGDRIEGDDELIIAFYAFCHNNNLVNGHWSYDEKSLDFKYYHSMTGLWNYGSDCYKFTFHRRLTDQ